MEHFYQDIKGWFAFRKQYEQLISELPNDAVWVEIGSFHGKSLAWLLVELYNNNKKFQVYAVDTWAGNLHEEFYINLRKDDPRYFDTLFEKFNNNLSLFSGKYTPIQMLSWDAANKFDDASVDYAMIDAGHDYDSVSKDIAAWWPKIKIGGYLGGDDYGFNLNDDVHRAVNEFVTKYDLTLTLLDSYKRTGRVSNKAKNWLIKKNN